MARGSHHKHPQQRQAVAFSMGEKKVAVVTASRSEYGLLRWVMDEIKNDQDLDLQVIVTGSHLSPLYGSTYTEIEKDGFVIAAKVDMLLSADSSSATAKSMGLCALGIADALERLKPDLLVVLGDRYELLPICSTALVMRIPIAHISGGDVTEGAIDDEIRNAVTQMSAIHFPGTRQSGDRLVSMGIPADRVFVAGEPGLDNFKRIDLLSRTELAESLGLDSGTKWVLLTYHPETKVSLDVNLSTVKSLVEALLNFSDVQIIATYANADVGGMEINNYLEAVSAERPGKISVVKSLGQRRYLSMVKECVLIAGNSSSGIVEAPFAGVPVLNIGNRQTGRYFCENVFSVASGPESIVDAVTRVLRIDRKFAPNFYYGDGNSSRKIKEKIRDFLGNGSK